MCTKVTAFANGFVLLAQGQLGSMTRAWLNPLFNNRIISTGWSGSKTCSNKFTFVTVNNGILMIYKRHAYPEKGHAHAKGAKNGGTATQPDIG